MNDDDLKQALKRAVAIVEGADVPEDLRQTALTHVLSSMGDMSPRSNKRRSKSRAASPAQEKATTGASARRSRKSGPKTLIAELVEEGAFDNFLTLPEVQERLRVNGYKYNLQALSPALLALTREKILQRQEKQTDGKKGILEYKKAAK
jgi:hypothetical protein